MTLQECLDFIDEAATLPGDRRHEANYSLLRQACRDWLDGKPDGRQMVFEILERTTTV